MGTEVRVVFPEVQEVMCERIVIKHVVDNVDAVVDVLVFVDTSEDLDERVVAISDINVLELIVDVWPARIVVPSTDWPTYWHNSVEGRVAGDEFSEKSVASAKLLDEIGKYLRRTADARKYQRLVNERENSR